MNNIQLNKSQMIATLNKCADKAEEYQVELTFEDSIDFLEGAVAHGFHSDGLILYIDNFIKDRWNK